MNFYLTDKQWEIIEPLVSPNCLDTRGRKRLSDRRILESILFVIQLGGSWRRLPKGEGLPSFQTCHRRYKRWFYNGVLDRVLEALAKDMEKRANIPLKDCFEDEIFEIMNRQLSCVFVEHLKEHYEDCNLPWDRQTRRFFESAWTWKFLLNTRSPWLSAQLPSDLEQRSNCRDFQPNL